MARHFYTIRNLQKGRYTTYFSSYFLNVNVGFLLGLINSFPIRELNSNCLLTFMSILTIIVNARGIFEV